MSTLRPLAAIAATTLVAGSLLAGCEQRTTTTTTPEGRTRTTTVEPNRTATEAAARTGDAVGDAAVTAKVKTALLADPDVKALKIDVDTKDGIVTLNGSADTRAHADKAVQVAQAVGGVKSVENRLVVR